MAVKVSALNGNYAEIAERFRRIRDAAEETQRKALRGKGYTTEAPDRIEAKAERLVTETRPGEIHLPPNAQVLGAERLIGSTNDIISTEFLELGQWAKRPVGRIEGGAGRGSGFLVGEGLLATNNHVLPSADLAYDATVVFGDEEERFLPNPTKRYYGFDPDTFFFTDPTIDTTLVAIYRPDNQPEIAHYGFLPLIQKQGKAIRGDPLSMVHHPEGGVQRLTVFNGMLLYIVNDGDLDPFFWHSCDTLPGSSGAPVFNARWEVVGMHRRGVPNTDKNNNLLDRNGKQMPQDALETRSAEIDWIANEAVRASRIVQSLTAHAFDDEAMIETRARLLKLWGRRRVALGGLMQSRDGFNAVG